MFINVKLVVFLFVLLVSMAFMTLYGLKAEFSKLDAISITDRRCSVENRTCVEKLAVLVDALQGNDDFNTALAEAKVDGINRGEFIKLNNRFGEKANQVLLTRIMTTETGEVK